MQPMIYILNLIIKSYWFLCPAFMANTAPEYAAKLGLFKRLAVPVDFNRNFFDGKPIFGNHKTFRGFLMAIAMAICIAYVQKLLFGAFSPIKAISIIDYSATSPLLIGFLMGFGALLGDLIKSFIKRRRNKKPGERWFPWDQIDFLPTTLLLVAFIVIPPLDMIICLIILSFALRVWIFPIIQKAIGIVR